MKKAFTDHLRLCGVVFVCINNIVGWNNYYLYQSGQHQFVHVHAGGVGKIEYQGQSKAVGTFVEILLICESVK